MKYLMIIGALVVSASATVKADVGKIAFYSSRSGNGDIYVMNPDGSSQTNVSNTSSASEGDPSWSADGAKIAYRLPDDIWTMNANGTGQTLIAPGNRPSSPDYHPSGNPVLFSKFGGFDNDIYRITSDGATLTKILSNPLGDYYPRWSPDGTKFTFYTFDSYGGQYRPNVFVANADGSGQTRLTTVGGCAAADWSPDGGQIVYRSAQDGNTEIYIMNADGSNQTRLTTNTSSEDVPTFSPDGTKIAFVSNRDGNNEIYIMNADGTNQTRLTNNAADDNFPSWGQTLPAGAPSVSINDITVEEGSTGTTNADFTISLSAASASPVTVQYRSFPGTAQADVDYTPLPASSVTFAPGETSKTISVPIIGDTIDEPNENFRVRLSAVGATIADQLGIATINDDDASPVLSINDITLDEGDAATSDATFTVSLNNASTQAISVQYATANGTAILNTDYNAANGAITIPAGQLSATIKVPVRGDEIEESDETFFVNLSNPTNATIGDGQGQATITNDDILPSLSIADIVVAEGGTATFTLSLSRASDTVISVDFATANGTAVQPGDYTAKTGTAIFAIGETTTTVKVVTVPETLVEKPETFFVNLSNASGAVIIDSQGLGTIANNDLPDLFISDVAMREGNVGPRNLYFTAALSSPAPFAVTVNYATADGTAVQTGDYTAKSGTITFSPGQVSAPIVIPVAGDVALEPDESFLVNLSSVSGAILADGQGEATIINDDTTPAITINDVNISEGNAGTTVANFSVSLSSPATSNVTVDFATANSTAIAGTDFAAQTGTLTIAAGQTSASISINVAGDTDFESNEVFFINLTNAANAVIADAQGRATILNDDTVPAISISDITVAEGNSGRKTATFTVSLNVASSQKVTVNYTTQDGTAIQPTDYTAKSGTLPFAPGVKTQTITVYVQGDTVREASETFYLLLSGAANATIADSQGMATITNDDDS